MPRACDSEQEGLLTMVAFSPPFLRAPAPFGRFFFFWSCELTEDERTTNSPWEDQNVEGLSGGKQNRQRKGAERSIAVVSKCRDEQFGSIREMDGGGRARGGGGGG